MSVAVGYVLMFPVWLGLFFCKIAHAKVIVIALKITPRYRTISKFEPLISDPNKNIESYNFDKDYFII